MRNPLPVAHWLLLHDSRLGVLEDSGYTKHAHPECEGFVFTRDHFSVHTTGFWIDREDHRILYSRPGKRFYLSSKSVYPHAVPLDAERLGLEEGFNEFFPILQRHEDWIRENLGREHRAGLFKTLPRAEKRYLKNWKVHFTGKGSPVTV